MPNRSRKKRPTDPNRLAAVIVKIATDRPVEEPRQKNPAAVALGRLGGLKGGNARAEKLSSRRKKEIARNAAISRWRRKAN